MKKTFLLVLAIMLISASFTGCDINKEKTPENTGITVGEKVMNEKISFDGAKIECLSATAESLTVKIVNNTPSTWQSGNMKDYQLEVELDGEWYTVTQTGELANTMELMIFAPGEEMTHTFNFTNRYGVLTAGKYRVVKSYWANATESTAAGEFHLVCEFVVK